jgi:tRNA dimethylallyltransferase
MTSLLIVICGSTATGKSGLALELAQHLDTVILSADSRQIYREFDIGTAKPSPTEQARVKHYLIDICEPTTTLTLAQYQKQAQALITSIPQPLILVGGTGLYIKSITRGLKIPPVAPQPHLRQQFQQLGQDFCYQILTKIDPTASERIHPHDETRTKRALEVFYVTGKPISKQQGDNPPSYPIIQIGLDSPLIEERIALRTQQMLEQGLVEEVRRLGEKYGRDLPLLDTLGYREIQEYLRGESSLDEAQARIILHTRQFAKRQRTWFRAIPEIHWLDSENPNLVGEALKIVGAG